MPIRQTHTFVILELSKAAFAEIEAKLKEANYQHAFIQDEDGLKIDMHGIAVQEETTKPPSTPTDGDGAAPPEPPVVGDAVASRWYVEPSKPWPRH